VGVSTTPVSAVHSIRFIAIDPAFEVHAAQVHSAADASREAAVEALWNEERRRPGGLRSDGSVLVFVEADRRRLVGRLARWRDVVAGRRAPELYGGSAPQPVQVGGLVACHGRVLLGQRRGVDPLGPESWELVPSRTLADDFLAPDGRRVDSTAALLAQLRESTPLPPALRAAPHPFALAHDARAGVWQVCLALDVEPGARTLEQIERAQSPDYAAFRFVRPVDVIESGMSGADELAPLSAALVRLPRVMPRVA
jgi:hypothetical protein